MMHHIVYDIVFCDIESYDVVSYVKAWYDTILY